jgi:hypothetical protein
MQLCKSLLGLGQWQSANPERWEQYITLLFQNCTKRGELLMRDKEQKTEQLAKFYQREDYLYVSPLDRSQVVGKAGPNTLRAHLSAKCNGEPTWRTRAK